MRLYTEVDPLDSTIEAGVLAASVAATKHSLPQTVFRNKDSAGWSHTNPFSKCLNQSQVFFTALPENYFH